MRNNSNNCGGYPSYQGGNYYPGYTAPVYQQPSVNTNKIYATGIDDVRSRQLPANSDFIFLDNDKPLIYRKTTDATGKMDVQIFKITPYQEEEKAQPVIDASNFVSIDAFRKLEEQFEELKQSLTKPAVKKTT